MEPGYSELMRSHGLALMNKATTSGGSKYLDVGSADFGINNMIALDRELGVLC